MLKSDHFVGGLQGASVNQIVAGSNPAEGAIKSGT